MRVSGNRSIRRMILGCVAAVVAVLLAVYLVAALWPTGYSEFRREHFARATADAPAPPANKEKTEAPTTASTATLTFFHSRNELSKSLENGSLGMTRDQFLIHPMLLSYSPLPYYQTYSADVPVQGFLFEEWRSCLEKLTNEALADGGKAISWWGEFGPLQAPAPLTPAADEMFRTMSRQAGERLLDQEPYVPTLEAGYWRLQHEEQSQWALINILQTHYEGDGKRTQERHAAYTRLVAAELGNRILTPISNSPARLEFLTLLLTDRGALAPEDLAAQQRILEESRLAVEDIEKIRVRHILATADTIKTHRSNVARYQGINTWASFLDGKPSGVVITAMLPVFHRRLEAFAMAHVKGDEYEIRTSEQNLLQVGKVMNLEVPAHVIFRNEELSEVQRHCGVMEAAPYLGDPDFLLNKDVDRLILTMAASRFRLETGAWPESPAILVPDYLPPEFLEAKPHLWRFAIHQQTDTAEKQFTIISVQYRNRFPVDAETNLPIPLESELLANTVDQLRDGPASIRLTTHRSTFADYEDGLRRILVPAAQEAPTP